MLPTLSKERLHYLAKLKQKKYRQAENLVIVEGQRTLQQLGTWGIDPKELYVTELQPNLSAERVYQVTAATLARICESEHPPALAGLFALPSTRQIDFRTAFYLEDISDPGNLGTIFRCAAAFGIETLILSPSCCELSSPKVIRASLGAVYHIPFWICEVAELKLLGAKICALDMAGTTKIEELSKAAEPLIIALGSEAHGLSPELKQLATETICIPITTNMESLNAAISFAISAYELHKSTLIK